MLNSRARSGEHWQAVLLQPHEQLFGGTPFGGPGYKTIATVFNWWWVDGAPFPTGAAVQKKTLSCTETTSSIERVQLQSASQTPGLAPIVQILTW